MKHKKEPVTHVMQEKAVDDASKVIHELREQGRKMSSARRDGKRQYIAERDRKNAVLSKTS